MQRFFGDTTVSARCSASRSRDRPPRKEQYCLCIAIPASVVVRLCSRLPSPAASTIAHVFPEVFIQRGHFDPARAGSAAYVACPCSIAKDRYARLEEFGCEVTIRSIARGERRPLHPQCATRRARRGIRGGRSEDIRGATCNASSARLGGM